MKQYLLFTLCMVSMLQMTNAYYGVDISSLGSEGVFSCLKDNGYTFAVVRCWESVGQPDSNCPHSLDNAWAAGLSHVDAYIFPCYSCGNPAGQVESMVKYIQSNGAKFGMIWFDIEGPGVYWSGNQADNRNFFSGMVEGAKAAGVNVGVYTSASQWEPIMGNWNGGASFPLWYAHYDGNPSFSDFSAFGGWSKPAIKQYNGDVQVCNLDVDQDYYP
ncbi:hypothetical protein SAMD00019534_048140 [Acytostelium subglobosum LB1]|uniref:hypothetical protein n=1 Tax=Acytostelium subglobosum LB1 TaxID=1410327 RepID=UPI000644E8AF|nr:hypothetical protein SAMD00019534_048140 [Acytostelium subglobosum LB1]GAM21639.1 hypothetical protein SAMD00019534_048140 [Acytostelium subglobosum LB1]|eukprot:XP_012755758.1 hypothetical protein SAMD00019534_048140 [Acytostelium subglobosum LB1]